MGLSRSFALPVERGPRQAAARSVFHPWLSFCYPRRPRLHSSFFSYRTMIFASLDNPYHKSLGPSILFFRGPLRNGLSSCPPAFSE